MKGKKIAGTTEELLFDTIEDLLENCRFIKCVHWEDSSGERYQSFLKTSVSGLRPDMIYHKEARHG